MSPVVGDVCSSCVVRHPWILSMAQATVPLTAMVPRWRATQQWRRPVTKALGGALACQDLATPHQAMVTAAKTFVALIRSATGKNSLVP
jgi:hypothetical protein